MDKTDKLNTREHNYFQFIYFGFYYFHYTTYFYLSKSIRSNSIDFMHIYIINFVENINGNISCILKMKFLGFPQTNGTIILQNYTNNQDEIWDVTSARVLKISYPGVINIIRNY